MSLAEESAVLSSWKDIARYLVRACALCSVGNDITDCPCAGHPGLPKKVRSCFTGPMWMPGCHRTSLPVKRTIPRPQIAKPLTSLCGPTSEKTCAGRWNCEEPI